MLLVEVAVEEEVAVGALAELESEVHLATAASPRKRTTMLPGDEPGAEPKRLLCTAQRSSLRVMKTR